MVDFNTRVFTEDDGKIIGAEVTVYSDSGDKLGLIDIADATTLAEMQQALAVIDETYFTEERLETLLTNTSETTEINATKLSGFLSSDFAKTSDLSSYAPAVHTHSKSQITDLYDYQIYASSYNVTIDGTVTITVKVTNRATGNPVVGVTVPVLKNNSSWQSGTTGVNGTFTLSYTADTWGITTFSAKTQNVQINVRGWKLVNTALDDGTNTIKVYSNGELAYYSIQLEDYSVAPGSKIITGFNTAYAPIEMIWITSAVYDLYSTIDTGVMRINNATSSTHNMLKVSFIAQLKTPLY